VLLDAFIFYKEECCSVDINYVKLCELLTDTYPRSIAWRG